MLGNFASDPDQAQYFVVPDLGLNCLQRLAPDKTCPVDE